ncbi:hypothetical protein AS19_07290 [Alcanivorax sp. NBRC 101098]|jgi:hypothetical protein|nr:hypothetical protein AS19_07290 [Alcanivorax sp. NBRC 101098]
MHFEQNGLESASIQIPLKANKCSDLMNPDTNLGSKIITLSEVSDDQEMTFLYS